MVLDPSCIGLVVSHSSGGDIDVGTGYAVSDRLVLTAGHLANCDHLAGREPIELWFGEECSKAFVLWNSPPDELDACLLELESPRPGPIGPLRWGRYTQEQPVAFDEICGFPTATRVTDEELGTLRETAGVCGYLTCTGGRRQDLLELVVDGRPLETTKWEGLSGAPVFCGGCLVGVVRSAPHEADGARIWATPMVRILEDPNVGTLLGRPKVEDVPHLSGLRTLLWKPSEAEKENAGPAQLLDARYGVVPFLDEIRHAELEFLRRWCDDTKHISVALLTGAGGSGKTRLLIEWCRRLREEEGWRAGFIEERATPEQLVPMLRGHRPTLLVIDYAERRPGLAECLNTLATRPEVPSLRIALLARSAGDWWDVLTKMEAATIRQFLTGTESIELSPVSVDDTLRKRVFDVSADAFAMAQQEAVPALSADLGDERFRRPLYLQMAALAAVDGLSLHADELLRAIVDREVRFWSRCFSDRYPNLYDRREFEERARRAVATLTLLGGAGSRAAATKRIKDIGMDDAEASRFVRLLCDLQSTDGKTLGVLEPELLGEALVASVLREMDTPETFLDLVFDGTEEDQVFRGFVVLGGSGIGTPRGSDDQARAWMHRVLRTDVGVRAFPAFEAALVLSTKTAFSSLGELLADVLPRGGTLELAQRMEPLLPHHTISLCDVAAWVIRTCLTALSAADNEERARLLSNLGGRLSELGRREEAFEAAEEATDIYRKLDATRPDVFNPNLAGSLNNLSAMRSGVGRREEALVAAEEATDIFRRLTAAQPDAHLPNLATSLNNLGGRLSALGRREEALIAAQEACDICRELTATGADAHLPNLATSLNNLGSRLIELGRREEGLGAAEEATEIYRRLTATRPDAFLPELATSLNNLGARLGYLGRREEALEAAQEGTEIDRRLAANRPHVFLPNLAASLQSLGNRLGHLGRREEALEAAQEAANIHRQLAAARRDAFLPNLAISLYNLGGRLSHLGRREEALEVAKEATDVCRRLADACPNKFLPDLARSLNNLGGTLRFLGRGKEALEVAQEGTDIYRELAAMWPDAFLADFAGSLGNLGNMLSLVGRCSKALEAVQEGTGIYRGLVAACPNVFLPELAMNLNNLGAQLSALGRCEEALEAAQEATDIRRRLVAIRPDAFLPDLAGSLNNLGVMLRECGRREEALEAAQKATDIHRQLAADCSHAFLPNLAGSLNNLSNTLSELDLHEEALEAAQEAAGIYRQLAATRPEAFLPDLAGSINNLGNRLAELDRCEEALEAVQEAICVLTPFFLNVPRAFAPRMAMMIRTYAERCNGHERSPDEQLLAPVLEVFGGIALDGPEAG